MSIIDKHLESCSIYRWNHNEEFLLPGFCIYCLYILCQNWHEDEAHLLSPAHNDIVPMINRYNWKHFVLFCKCEKEIVNDVNSWAGHHCYDCTSAHTGWDRGLYEIIVQCPPFPLILLLFFEFVSLCFHVLLVIRLSAGLYWITPEAHQRINDVGSERGTQIQRLIKSRALQIIVMWWISLKSSKAMNGGLNWIEISILGSFLI